MENVATVELACIAILLMVVWLRSRTPGAGEWLRDAPLIWLAALIAEDTSIRLYGFYEYAPGWHLFLDRVPALIPTIWIFVVLSARDFCRFLWPARATLLSALMVWYDAAFIEPIASTAGLWSWTVPGPFGVPLVGVFGWALFALATLVCLERPRGWMRLSSVVLVPAATHLGLLAAWWGAFRWLPRGGDLSATAVAVALGLGLVASAVVFGKARSAPLSLSGPRMPPALLFVVLLVVNPAPTELVVYALSFAVPWLMMVRWSWTAPTPAAPRLT